MFAGGGARRRALPIAAAGLSDVMRPNQRQPNRPQGLGKVWPNYLPEGWPPRAATDGHGRFQAAARPRAVTGGCGRPWAARGGQWNWAGGGGQLAMCWLVYGSGENGCAHFFLRLGGASLLHGGCFMLWGKTRCPLIFWAPPLAAFLAYLPSEIIVFCFSWGRQGNLWAHQWAP